MRFLAVLIAALIFAAPSFGYSRYSSIDEAATWLANGRKVHVRCLTPEETASDMAIVIYGATAYVDGEITPRTGRWRPGRFTVFSHGVCETITAFQEGRGYRYRNLAWALLVLTHEAGHLRGHLWSQDEAKTETWALRHVVYTAQHFGVPDSRLLLREALRHHNQLPDDYKTPGCTHPFQDENGLLQNCK